MYYKITIGFDKLVYGTDWPQTNETIYPCSIYDPLFIRQWKFKKTPKNIITPIPKLKAKAILTDLIGTSSNGSEFALIISEKLKMILEKYNTDHVEFISIKMQKGVREIKGYWMTNIIGFDNREAINYAKCTIKYFMCRNREEIFIKTFDEFLEAKKGNEGEMIGILIYKLILKEKIDKDFIILDAVNGGGVGYYVSEKLKKEIEDEGCTGIVFEPVEQA